MQFMRKKSKIFWACDFETTVWGPALERARGKKQDETEVWSAAYVQLYDEKEDVHIDGNIESFLSFFSAASQIMTCYISIICHLTGHLLLTGYCGINIHTCTRMPQKT